MELRPKIMQSFDTKESSLYNSISEELSCIICFERMSSPKLLKCCHIFCVTCLEKTIKKNGKITCPACRKNTKVNIFLVFTFKIFGWGHGLAEVGGVGVSHPQFCRNAR